MRRILNPAVILLISLISCTYEIERPSSQIEYNGDYSHHPKDSLYQSIVDKYVDEGLVGLSVLVRDPEEGLWMGAAGYASVEDQIPMNPNHVHYASSITKSYTAAMIMLLREAGQIDLDACMDNFLPDRICDNIPNGHSATVLNLLTHTSGIPDYTGPYLIDVLNNYDYAYTPEELLEYVYGPYAFWEPGGGFAYSNTNFILLALIADGITGDHAAYLQQQVLDPLGLENTYYKNHPDYPQPEGLVNSYSEFYREGEISNFSDVQNTLTSAYIGEDGLMATPYDFARFFEALFRGQIVSTESLEEMTTWVSERYPENFTRVDGQDYGLGLYYRTFDQGYSVGHDGSLLANNVAAMYFPDHDVTVVLCTNCSGTILPELFDEELIPQMVAAVLAE